MPPTVFCWLTAWAAAAPPEPPVRFTHEVAAVLSKAGCNAGACHGNLNGKGGLKLSLRGEDPAFDRLILSRDALGRRADPLRPDDSLLLQKATGGVPHEGGRRFGTASEEYAILRRWIAAGLPADPEGTPALTRLDVTPARQVLIDPDDRTAVRATAHFSDGTKRDVTRLAVFETANLGVAEVTPGGGVKRLQPGEAVVIVRYLDRQATVRLAFVPARPDFVWRDVPAANFIDEHVFAKLKSLRTQPSELCDDATFLRRATIDLLGVPPTADEARAFLDSPRPDKRARLVDALLQRPEFADHWALKWSDLLRNEEKALDRKGVQAFHYWIRKQIADGRPMNEFARDLIAARGSTYAQPQANYYRALREPQLRAEATAQVFLGLRIGCAKCHNHPFDVWTQDDYHRFAALFARVQYRIVTNKRRDNLDSHEFDGEQVVWMGREGELKHPRTGDPLVPKFLGSAAPPFPEGADRLQALADWVASPDNPFFAKAQANRVWFHLLGRGLVDPDDDFRATNPATHPELLDSLAKDFADHQFDLRHLVRTVVNSRTYQLSATPNDTNRSDDQNFSRALVQPLEAEQLLDAISRLLEVPVKFDGYPAGVRAGQLPGAPQRPRGRVGDAERFLRAFGKPDRLLNCDCERSDDTTLVQAFQMMTGEMLHEMLTEPGNRVGRLLKAGRGDAEVLEELFLAALARRPTGEERAGLEAYLKKAKDRRKALEDVAWGLANAKEFLLRALSRGGVP